MRLTTLVERWEAVSRSTSVRPDHARLYEQHAVELRDAITAADLLTRQLVAALTDLRNRVADGVRFPPGSTDLADAALDAANEAGVHGGAR